MTTATLDGVRLHRLMTGYLSSKAIFVAVQLGVFDVLAAGPATAEAVGSKIDLPARAARVLLLALEGEEIVTRDGDEYANTPLSTAFLVSSSSRYLGALARHQDDHYNKLTRLEEALRADAPVDLGEQYTGQFQAGPQVWARRWAEVFRASAQLMAEDLAAQVDLAGRRHLIDLGCASCAYSISFAKANPSLRVSAVDQPAIAEVAKEFVAEAGMAQRVTVRPGNIFADRFPDCDVALLSHVIQGFDRDRARGLLAHVYEWLPTDGLLVIHSHLPERAGAPFPYQFGLILLINNTQGGEPHGQATTERWLREIGFRDVSVADVSPLSAVLVAKK
ncbi:MAG TPA: methyltransferase [Micromonosporaceae bacterium]|nr:methyltransferase [Micromonosporaceae bacterium]